MQTVEEATKALWDYINSLPPIRREEMTAYQKGLEAEAAKTDGGMSQVIIKRMHHNAMLLEEITEELNEHFSSEQAARAIEQARNK